MLPAASQVRALHQDLFSKTTQKPLLTCFRVGLNGHKGVKIGGRVAQDLVQTVKRELG